MPQCTKKDWFAIKSPKKNSYKGQNGKLLILAGSQTYHGALILSIKAAVRFCDLVYVFTHQANDTLLAPLKAESPNIIVLTPQNISQFFKTIDAYLAGPGWEKNLQNQTLLKKMLLTKKPIVIDATALSLLDLNNLHKKVLLTPHKKEFEELFKLPPTEKNAKAMAKKYKCTILLKGQTDVIASPTHSKQNKTGNQGMTKGGTGDVLAGLTAALLAAKNTPYKSACAAAYLNGLAADSLEKRMGPHFSSEDLANELPLTAQSLEVKKAK